MASLNQSTKSVDRGDVGRNVSYFVAAGGSPSWLGERRVTRLAVALAARRKKPSEVSEMLKKTETSDLVRRILPREIAIRKREIAIRKCRIAIWRRRIEIRRRRKSIRKQRTRSRESAERDPEVADRDPEAADCDPEVEDCDTEQRNCDNEASDCGTKAPAPIYLTA